MRLVFCGTAAFAVPSLRACRFRHQVVLVVSQPPRPGDRGRPAPRPAAEAARELQIPVLEPERIRASDAVEAILGSGADALVVAAYGQIIPTQILDGHRLGGVNVHGSLLPRWRGAAPVAHAILAGDHETGVSIMRVEAGLDTGPVYASRPIVIRPRTTTPELTEDLAVAGAEELVSVLAALERGTAVATPQPEEGVTYAPRLTRADGIVDWAALSAVEIDRRVRALQPWPGVVAALAGIEVRIVAGLPLSEAAASQPPGAVVASGQETVDVATRDGVYRVQLVQPPGKRAMPAAAYLRGRR